MLQSHDRTSSFLTCRSGIRRTERNGRGIALRDARSDTSYRLQPEEPEQRRTIGSRSRSAVYTNEVAPHS